MTRSAQIERTTKETSIRLKLDLDGTGKFEIHSGIGFFDHMLEQLAFHSQFDLKIYCEGDLHTGCHHTTEDIGIAVGEAFLEALGDRRGIQRYAHAYIPMDEALLRTVVDISGRPEFYFHGEFKQPSIGTLDTQMISHFFKSFAMASRITLHMSILYGSNDHHMCEGLFKSLARALKIATIIENKNKIMSTKGSLV